MPEIIPLGWFHTIMGIIALGSGAFSLFKYKEIVPGNRSAQIYLVTTLITAATALMIYQHGGFGIAHALAVATLAALGVGMLAAMTKVFGNLSRYVRALSFTATLFFHSIPAVTDGLLRLPVGDPVVSSLDDPLMQGSHLALLVIFLVGVTLQLRWIRRQGRSGD